MKPDPILDAVEKYYTARLKEHGVTARGVDWNSTESQTLRFEQLCRLFGATELCSVIDYGCGYGALLDYLRGINQRCNYSGLDISSAMVEAAHQMHLYDKSAKFFQTPNELIPADYVLASGIFNVRLGNDDSTWQDYMLSTVEQMAELSIRGFAFNVLTKYSDPERRRPDLHYADPLFWFDHCKRKYSRFVSLLHDYPLYEFTILVKK